ncbi:MAG: hypothetical protein DSZ11_00085, partial [Sulfurovum sp.]
NSLNHKEPKREHLLSPNKDVPTITLINGNKIYLDLGKKFIDPGVIAEDSNGVPLDVEVIGDINVSQVNSYPLHYLAIDKNGNATSVTRTIVIVSKDIKDIRPKKVVKKVVKKEVKKEKKEESIENNNSEVEINSEEEKLEDIYRKDRGEEEEEQSEQQEEIDAIFANAEGDTQEEKLEDKKLEELMDREE